MSRPIAQLIQGRSSYYTLLDDTFETSHARRMSFGTSYVKGYVQLVRLRGHVLFYDFSFCMF